MFYGLEMPWPLRKGFYEERDVPSIDAQTTKLKYESFIKAGWTREDAVKITIDEMLRLNCLIDPKDIKEALDIEIGRYVKNGITCITWSEIPK